MTTQDSPSIDAKLKQLSAISMTSELQFVVERNTYVDPTGADTIYAYRCDAGHQHEILSADNEGEAVVGLTFVKPVAGAAPAQIVRESALPLFPATQRDWPSIYLARVLSPRLERAR